MHLHLGYHYYTWSIRDQIPPINIGDRVALKPHDSKDYRGKLIRTYDTAEGTMLGVVRMDIDGREKHIEFDSRDIRYVYRHQEGSSVDLIGNILIVGETVDFRSCARSQVFAEDLVVEIGSSFGETSVILAKFAGKLVGFDISAECVDACRAALPQGEFHCADCYKESSFIVERCQSCNVVFIDIGGNRCIRDQLEMLNWVQVHLRPELIVQKSRLLYYAALKYEREMGVISGLNILPSISEWISTVMASVGNRIDKSEKLRRKRMAKRNLRRQATEQELSENAIDTVDTVF